MKNDTAKLAFGLQISMRTVRGASTLLMSLLLQLFIVQSISAQTVNKEKRYPYPFAVVWQAAAEILQERGLPIVHVDKETGIITTDFKSDEEDWRYKFNLRISASGDSASMVRASCTVESASNMGLTWENERSEGREDQLLRAIAERLDPNSPGPSVPSPNCLSNFRIGGSVVRGTNYSSFEEFSGLTPEAASRSLISSFARESLTVSNGESTTDTFVAIGSIGGREASQAEFSITPIGGGVRISVKYKLPVGRRGRDDLVRDHLCGVLGGVGRTIRRPLASAPPASTADDAASIESRLRKLEELFKKGVITEEEYKKKRAELLSKF